MITKTLDNLADEMLIYAVEHENDTSYNKIAYNISKLLNVKAENKVMIGYITEYKTKLDTKQKKEKVFEKINEQLKKIPAKYFRSEERLLVILGEEGMTESSGYDAVLYKLKSKDSYSYSSEKRKFI